MCSAGRFPITVATLGVVLIWLAPPVRAESGPDVALRTDSATVVEMTQKVTVYARPAGPRGKKRGQVAQGARFRVQERADGPGCEAPWLRIGTRAWVCSSAARPTGDGPTRQRIPRLRDGAALPYPYLVTREDAPAYDSLSHAEAGEPDDTIGGTGGFRRRRTARVNGSRYYKTPRGWIAAEHVEQVEPSEFRGVELGADDLGKRLAFVVRKRARYYDDSGRRLRGPGPPRHQYLGEIGAPVRRGGVTLHPLADGRHVRQRDVRLVDWKDPPDEVEGLDSGERWLDVSLSQQTLVAYEGTRPVLATLVSTGRTSTPAGVFRIKKKRAFGRLRNLPDSERKWDVHVPWVMTLEGRIAMHVAYWHENFGRPFSAGCINLSPNDGKWMWEFTQPALPPGWFRVRSDRGTVIRVRR